MLGMLPILCVHAMQLWSRPHYQFFPAILVVGLLLVLARWPASGWQCDSVWRAVVARCLYLAGLVVLVLAVAKISPLLAWGAFCVTAAGVIVHGRLPLWGPWLLCLLLLRLPHGLDVQLVQWLQSVSTELSSMALDALQIEHNSRGNIIQLPHRPLFVEEACSGVVSLMTLVATGVVFSVWMRRSILHGVLLAASGAFWACALNVFRLCVIVAAIAWYDVDLLSETRHAILGTVSFLLAAALMLSTDRLLCFLLGTIPADPMSPLYDQVEGNPLVSAWNFVNPPPPAEETPPPVVTTSAPQADRGLGWRVFDGLLATVAVALAGAQFYAGIGPFRISSQVPEVVSDLGADFLDPEYGPWTERQFIPTDRGTGSDFGEHSRIWKYFAGTSTLEVSVDYPFQEWHELGACYRGRGWKVDKTEVLEGSTRELEMTLFSSERALLIFDLYKTDGSPYEVPAGDFLHPTWRRVLAGGSRWSMPTYLQLQVLMISNEGEITDEMRDEARQVFEEFRARILGVLQQ
jgi:exosortase